MEYNISVFFKTPVHIVEKWKMSEKKKSYIAILYNNKKNKDVMNDGIGI